MNRKVFVFLGVENATRGGVTVKLRESHEEALALPGATPTGYGLGRSGWVTISLDEASPPSAVLQDWIDESYRLVAPKRLVGELDRQGGGTSRQRSPRT